MNERQEFSAAEVFTDGVGNKQAVAELNPIPQEDSPVQEPPGRAKMRKERQLRQAQEEQAMLDSLRNSKPRSKQSSTRYYPVSIMLAETALEDYFMKYHQAGQPRPSNSEVVMGAALAGIRKLRNRPSLVSRQDLRDREYDSKGREVVFWLDASLLDGLQVRDPKGFLELALIAALDPGDWESMAVEAPARPTVQDVAGCFE